MFYIIVKIISNKNIRKSRRVLLILIRLKFWIYYVDFYDRLLNKSIYKVY